MEAHQQSSNEVILRGARRWPASVLACLPPEFRCISVWQRLRTFRTFRAAPPPPFPQRSSQPASPEVAVAQWRGDKMFSGNSVGGFAHLRRNEITETQHRPPPRNYLISFAVSRCLGPFAGSRLKSSGFGMAPSPSP